MAASADAKMAASVTAICAEFSFSVCAPVCISKICDETNGAGTNNWIPVKNSNSDNIRRKNTQQLNDLIALCSNFAVLDNLYVSPDKDTISISMVHNALRAQTNRPKTSKKHSVLLVGDIEIRDVAERMAIELRSSFRTIGYIKTNANLNNIAWTVKSEIKNSIKNCVVVLCGGTLDVVRNNTSIGLYFEFC